MLGREFERVLPASSVANLYPFNYRDHRKITCVDGDIAYTGGANIADEYANLIERFGYWKDCGLRMEGEGAWGLTREFLQMWQRMDGQLYHEYGAFHDERVSTEAERHTSADREASVVGIVL